MNKREEEKLKKQQERLEKEIARTKAMSTFEEEYKDYPYICDDTSEKSILKTIEYARSTCGEEQWNKGLRTMKNIDKAISYEGISRQFNDMVQEIRRVNG